MPDGRIINRSRHIHFAPRHLRCISKRTFQKNVSIHWWIRWHCFTAYYYCSQQSNVDRSRRRLRGHFNGTHRECGPITHSGRNHFPSCEKIVKLIQGAKCISCAFIIRFAYHVFLLDPENDSVMVKVMCMENLIEALCNWMTQHGEKSSGLDVPKSILESDFGILCSDHMKKHPNYTTNDFCPLQWAAYCNGVHCFQFIEAWWKWKFLFLGAKWSMCCPSCFRRYRCAPSRDAFLTSTLRFISFSTYCSLHFFSQYRCKPAEDRVGMLVMIEWKVGCPRLMCSRFEWND